jgi:hypothetical protein
VHPHGHPRPQTTQGAGVALRLVSHTIQCPGTRSEVEIHHLTDLHIDQRGHAQDKLDERIARIAANPLARWVGGGDYASLITPTDPRYHAGTHEITEGREGRMVDYALERAERRLKPIADKCLGFGIGNHEQTIAKKYHRGFGPELAKRLGVTDAYLGYKGWIAVAFVANNRSLGLTIYQHHGWSGGRLKGRKALQAERDIGAFGCDILLCGHDHQPWAHVWKTQEPYHSSRSGWGVRNRTRVALNGGAWEGSDDVTLAPPIDPDELSAVQDDSWASTKNFRPEPIGGPWVVAHLDFGRGTWEAGNQTGRPAGIELEVRQRA